MPECKRCREETATIHSNADVGFAGVCDACQAELHTAFRAATSARRAARLSAPSAGGS